jgi:hypothetical protein
MVQGAFMGAGATIALVLVLVRLGPGSIFPIVVAVGAIVVTASTTAGMCAAWALRLPLLRSHARK